MSDKKKNRRPRTLVDLVISWYEEEVEREREERRKRRERDESRKYVNVYNKIKDMKFDNDRAEKSIKCFRANRQVKVDDLIECLKCFDFDHGRLKLIEALREPIESWNYFEREKIEETFTWASSIPEWVSR